MVNYRTVREALGRARTRAEYEVNGERQVGLTLDQAEALSGINRATIHSIENVKREPNLRPKIDTIDRLAETYGLTLLFSLVPNEGLPVPVLASDNALSPLPQVNPTDDALSTLTAGNPFAQALYSLASDHEKAIREALRDRAARERGAHRGSAAGNRGQPPAPRPPARSDHARTRPRRQPARKRKRPSHKR